MRILTIDDDHDFLEIFQFFLKKHIPQCSILKLEDPTKIFQNFNSGDLLSFDLIISDYDMKKIDGIQLRNYLKSNGLNIPFIMVSSHDIVDIKQKYPGVCIDYFVQKRPNIKAFIQELVYHVNNLTNNKNKIFSGENRTILLKN